MSASTGSAAQHRNKIWLRGGVLRHFSHMLGLVLLIPVYLTILLVATVFFFLIWSARRASIRCWLQKPLGEPAAIVLLALMILLAITIYGPFAPRYSLGQETVVVLERGLGVREIAAKLARADVISSTGQFLFLSRLLGLENRLQAGKYSFPPDIKPLGVLKRLSRGGVLAHMITVPEGMTVRQMSQLLAAESGVDAEHFQKLANDPDVAHRYGIAAANLEGYLFPDTYGLYWGMPAEQVIDILAARFHHVYTENMANRAKELGMDRHQVITMASMIEEEARIPEERAVISAVYHNRLNKGMLLQCDPTVIYALGGKEDPLTRQDLEVDSPYNTYLHPGLPPGPISNPGEASIRAALYPAEVDYLYFVAQGDGSHHFSRTSREHINAIRRIRRNMGG